MPSPSADDSAEFAELLTAARGGNKAALGKILAMYRGMLLAVAKQSLGNDVRAKLEESDVVQQTLAEAGGRLSQFEGTEAHELAAWLKVALVNNVRDGRRRLAAKRRKVTREVSIDADSEFRKQLMDDSPSPSSRIRQLENHRVVDRALDGLPPEYREVLVLRHRENLDFVEIARRLGRSENAVRKLWARAVAKLRQELADDVS